MTNSEILAKRISVFPSDGDMTDEAIKRNVYVSMDAAREDEAGKWEAQLKDERERVAKLREALEGVIRVADRKTAEFDKAKEALTY